ncbi:MAG: hypothetical protein LBT00_15635 [Spirochaetaceae bacterium]|nr:hypothetical protein [Spirochaetaceae bacterium]
MEQPLLIAEGRPPADYFSLLFELTGSRLTLPSAVELRFTKVKSLEVVAVIAWYTASPRLIAVMAMVWLLLPSDP